MGTLEARLGQFKKEMGGERPDQGFDDLGVANTGLLDRIGQVESKIENL